MASDALLLLVGVPENYRLGGPETTRILELTRIASSFEQQPNQAK